MFFDPPADGTYQVRSPMSRARSSAYAHAFRVTVRPPKPDFAANATVGGGPTEGRAVPVNVTVTRFDGSNGPVGRPVEEPAGRPRRPATSVQSGHNAATFAIFANPNTSLTETRR